MCRRPGELVTVGQEAAEPGSVSPADSPAHGAQADQGSFPLLLCFLLLPLWPGLDQDVLYILSKGKYQAQNVPQARKRQSKNSHEEVLPTQNREALL